MIRITFGCFLLFYMQYDRGEFPDVDLQVKIQNTHVLNMDNDIQ